MAIVAIKNPVFRRLSTTASAFWNNDSTCFMKRSPQETVRWNEKRGVRKKLTPIGSK